MISIVIPTYNEAKNIPILVKRISEILGKKYDYEVIIVDDDSPDKTWKVGKDMMKKYPFLHVLRRTKDRGLSQSVLAGFKVAKGDVLGVMDADLSHPPEKLPALIDAVTTKGYDISIGSRLTRGGKVEDWPWYRKMISDVARAMARPLTPVKDIMSGYFFLKRKVVKGKKIKVKGYKILLEILVKGRHKKVKEVPILFRNRTVGDSKLGAKVYVDYVKQLGSLYKYRIFG